MRYANQVNRCFDFDDPTVSYRMAHLLQTQGNAVDEAGLLNELPEEVYLSWLKANPRARLQHVLGWVPFTQSLGNGREQWHPDFEKIVNKFLTRKDELVIIEQRFFPTSWSGSLADQLEPHLPLLQNWWRHPKAMVRDWALNAHARLLNVISEERRGDANRDIKYHS